MLGHERLQAALHWFGQRVVSRALVGEFSVTADRGDRARIKQRRPRRHPLERIVGVPHPSAQLETPSPAFLGPDLVFEIEIGNIGNFLTDAQRRVLAMHPNRYIEQAEMARKIEMLVLREMLIGEDQHRVFRKSIVDGGVIGWLDRLRQIDIADLSGKTRRDRKNCDGHVCPHDVHIIARRQLDHFRSMDAIGSLRSPAPIHPNPLKSWNAPELTAQDWRLRRWSMGGMTQLLSVPEFETRDEKRLEIVRDAVLYRTRSRPES